MSEQQEETIFDVSIEELSIIRAELACDFPDDYLYLSDDYIISVASKPYSKDPTIRRPLDYSIEKLKDLLKWREDNATSLSDLLELSRLSSTDPEAVEQPEKYTKASALAVAFNNSAIYWHGLDKKGRPILWIRCDRMPWFPDVDAQVNGLILLADGGIQAMPKGVTDFVVLSDSNSPPPPNPQFLIRLLGALIKGYPDRLHELVSCPVGTIIQSVMKLLSPLMPTRLASKIVLISQEDSQSKLSKILLNGEADIPTFMGGTCDHDKFYPPNGINEGPLKFDFDGMTERLRAELKAFHK